MTSDDEGAPARWTLVRARSLATGAFADADDVGLLLHEGRIVDAGALDQVRPQAEHVGAAVLDLGDRTLLPGLIDGHNHQPSAVRDRFEVSTAQVTSIEELLNVVAASTTDLPRGHWIVTERNLTRAQLSEGRYPTADELSAVAPDHPVSVRFGAHSMVLNRAAFELLGLAEPGVLVRRGRVERDGNGRPSGPIHEYGVTRLVTDRQPALDESELVGALAHVQASYLRAGITTVRIPGVRSGELGWYQRLRQQGRLLNRAVSCVRIDPNLDGPAKRDFIDGWEVATGFGDDSLALDAMKLFVDGGVGPADQPTTRFLDGAELVEVVSHAVSRGWGVTCHAVTTEAIGDVLTAYTQIQHRFGGRHRLAIEHALFASTEQVAQCAQMGVWLSLQPSLLHLNGHLLNTAGSSNVIDAGAAHRAGARVALGSDWNATPGTTTRPYAPFQTLGHVMTSSDIPLRVAVELHTAAVGRLVGRPELGRLSPGGVADLVAVPDPLPDLAERLRAGEVPRPTEVVLAGRLVLAHGQMSA